jgi:MinD superfamily P-loop ATPase
MREITLLSGKGGTGKTSITAALASLAKNAVFCDNDVDAANLHLIFHPAVNESHIFEGAYIATIHPDICNLCGICRDHCRFNAIRKTDAGTLEIDPYKCEGCRLCERVCPENAISTERSKNNQWYLSTSRFGTIVHAKMGPGEENSGKLVTTLRGRARKLAKDSGAEWIINDGPPGIGCAAISSLSGVDAAILVTEPTKSGFHDLERIVELIESFGIPGLAIINKYDLHPGLAKEIQDFLKSRNIRTIAKIPFSEIFVNSMVSGKNVIEYDPVSEIAMIILQAWEKINSKLDQ